MTRSVSLTLWVESMAFDLDTCVSLGDHLHVSHQHALLGPWQLHTDFPSSHPVRMLLSHTP
jgi:hypothetical protein